MSPPRSTKPASLRVRAMSNETLIKNAETIGAEIARRVAELGDGLKHLGIDGLKLAAANKKQALITFPGYTKQYLYSVPEEAAVGDTVETPAPYTHGTQSLGRIVRLGGNGYTGPVKDVLALYKQTHRKG